MAVISEEDLTLKSLAAAPNLTPVTPANPEPVIVTPAPIVPEPGLIDLTAGAAAAPGTRTSSQARPSAWARIRFCSRPCLR